jgi:hypothetical protein
MELKTARLTLLIDPNKKAAFERLCAQHDLTASQVVRQMIRDYLVHYGVSYTPSGQAPDEPATARSRPSPRGRKVAAPAKTAKARPAVERDRAQHHQHLAPHRLDAGHGRAVAGCGPGRCAGLAPPGLCGAGAVSAGGLGRPGAGGVGVLGLAAPARGGRAVHRPARVAAALAAGQPVGVLPAGGGCGFGRHLGLRRRLLPQRRRHTTGPAVF